MYILGPEKFLVPCSFSRRWLLTKVWLERRIFLDLIARCLRIVSVRGIMRSKISVSVVPSQVRHGDSAHEGFVVLSEAVTEI